MEQLVRVFEERSKKIVLIQSLVRTWLAQSRFQKTKWEREKAVVKLQACKTQNKLSPFSKIMICKGR
jgi:hypothetical protein